MRSERLCAGACRVLLASGGDDQSLRLTHFEITWMLAAPAVAVLASVHVPNAHSSALRVHSHHLLKPAALWRPSNAHIYLTVAESSTSVIIIHIWASRQHCRIQSTQHNMVAQYWGKPSGLVLLLVGLPELSLVCINRGSGRTANWLLRWAWISACAPGTSITVQDLETRQFQELGMPPAVVSHSSRAATEKLTRVHLCWMLKGWPRRQWEVWEASRMLLLRAPQAPALRRRWPRVVLK